MASKSQTLVIKINFYHVINFICIFYKHYYKKLSRQCITVIEEKFQRIVVIKSNDLIEFDRNYNWVDGKF